MDQVYTNIRPANLANALFCLVVGFGLNGTLLWLIKTQKDRELIKWRWILLQTCLTDMFLIVLWFFIQPVVVTDASTGTQWVILNCPLGNVPNLVGFILFDTYYTCLLFMVGAISVQFIFRYFILCRLKKFAWKKYLPALLLLFGWLLFLALIRLPAGNYPEPGYEQLPDSLSFYLNGRKGNGKINSAFFTKANSTESVRFWLTLLERCQYGTNLAYLAINILCAWRIRKFVVKTMTDSKQSQLMEINRQLTINLILQGIVPLVRLALITLSAYVAMYLTNDDEQLGLTIGLYSLMANSWIPLINPTITLLVIRPFREFILRKLFCCRRHNDQQQQMSSNGGNGNSTVKASSIRVQPIPPQN